MTEPIEQFTSLKDLTMTPSERTAMRQRLLAFTQTHAVRSTWTAVLARHTFAYAFSALALLVGTTTALAHQAKPGDLLYPLRLAVNDRVAVAVAGDEDARIQKELEQISRAISEEEVVIDATITLESNDVVVSQTPSHEGTLSDVELDAELRAMEHDIGQEEASISADLEI